MQHERKMRATFLFSGKDGRGEEKIDAWGVVHPPYRAFGTGTGRTGGGADDATNERKADPYSFNVLNIPEECRAIYVPHDRLRWGRLPGTKEDVEAAIDRLVVEEYEEEEEYGE